MQIFNLNISAFIDKINDYAIFIISFLQTIFNNIIAIKNVSFIFFNIFDSIGIIFNFILSLVYILIFITILCFSVSIFDIIKSIIKYTIYWPIKLLILVIYYFLFLLKYLFIPKSRLTQPVEFNKRNPEELKQLNKKISDLEYKLYLQNKQNIIKKGSFKNDKK
ncbi:hypothetical protein [Hydrangea phyllody phytoplasma]|uniref:hypothetical protein n=1 Tax=Hydrangea phyllody phytoplasma TaxID=238673 RepID=UPI002D1FEF4B|nr:hypothetical protein HP2P_1750 [Hydrangea phyllody phytoplasma]